MSARQTYSTCMHRAQIHVSTCQQQRSVLTLQKTVGIVSKSAFSVECFFVRISLSVQLGQTQRGVACSRWRVTGSGHMGAHTRSATAIPIRSYELHGKFGVQRNANVRIAQISVIKCLSGAVNFSASLANRSEMHFTGVSTALSIAARMRRHKSSQMDRGRQFSGGTLHIRPIDGAICHVTSAGEFRQPDLAWQQQRMVGGWTWSAQLIHVCFTKRTVIAKK